MLTEVVRSIAVVVIWSVLAFGLLLAGEFVFGLQVDSPTTGILAMALIAATFVICTEARDWLRSHRILIKRV